MADNQPQTSPFMTVTEVADYMRVSRMTVYRLVEDDELAATRIVRSIRVYKDSVEAYLQEHR